MNNLRKYKLGFIILQYGRSDLTRDCIESIESHVKDVKKLIIVVDNLSPDNSLQDIKERYNNREGIVILESSKNIGFAQGNNLGYTYARKLCDFLCILNSDVVLTQDDFWTILKESYEYNQFALAGPYIYLPNMQQSEMLMPEIQSYAVEKKKLKKKKLNAKLAHMGLNPLREKLGDLKRRGKKMEINEMSLHRPHENIVLNGCCLIYTPVYMERFAEAFDPRTFFYGEENLLFLKVRQAGMKTYYEPKLKVEHLLFASTQMESKQKTCFQLDNAVKAQELLLEELCKVEEKTNIQ